MENQPHRVLQEIPKTLEGRLFWYHLAWITALRLTVSFSFCVLLAVITSCRSEGEAGGIEEPLNKMALN
jgi:hypothetical protein